MRVIRRALVTAGALVMGYSIIGALTDADVQPVGVLLFLAGVLIAHDAILLPLTIGVGVLIGRYTPARISMWVRVAAIVSLPPALVALPLVLGFGRLADNPSVLPLPYGRGLAVTLAAIWSAAATAAGIQAWRHRKESERTPPVRMSHDGG